VVREYAARHAVPWRQMAGEDAERLKDLMVIHGLPGVVVIDQRGVIAGRGLARMESVLAMLL
jgi:hypothetical protein